MGCQPLVVCHVLSAGVAYVVLGLLSDMSAALHREYLVSCECVTECEREHMSMGTVDFFDCTQTQHQLWNSLE